MEKILQDILSKKINFKDLRNWFLYSDDVPSELRVHDPSEFAFFVLSFLRESTASILSPKTPADVVGVRNGVLSISEGHTPSPKHQQQQQQQQQRGGKHSTTPLTAKSPNQTLQTKQRTSPSQITLANFIVARPASGGRQSNKNKRNKGAENESNRLGSPTEVAAPKRRINPTKVCPSNEGQFGSPARLLSPHNPFTSVEEQVQSATSCERPLRPPESRLSPTTELPNLQALSIRGVEKPVTHRAQLDTLSQLYSLILTHDLALNIMSELYFLTELLTLPDASTSEHELFSTAQNCAYFAAVTLEKQRDVLKWLDPTTLRLFVENEALSEHAPELVNFLRKLKQPMSRTSSVCSQVTYQTDVDEKQNFSNQGVFLQFRKIRDSFYTILEKWDVERHFTPQLISSVQAIFKQNMEPELYVHFCTFFVSQLIASCVGEGAGVTEKSATIPLSCDPTRLRRLQERLVTPAKGAVGATGRPQFGGWEVFFKEWVELVASHRLCVHLGNALVAKIVEINAQQFAASELQDSETRVDEETSARFLTAALSGQLLAKFLGHLTFSPYLAAGWQPELALDHQAAVRTQVCPPLDCSSLLQSALAQGQVVLTVPWLCAFLAHLDPASLRLPHYARLVVRLVALRRELPRRPLSHQGGMLVRLSVGWLLAALTETSPQVWQLVLQARSVQCQDCPSGPCLDRLDVLDGRALSSLCPHVAGLRARLAAQGGPRGVQGPAGGPRHITPVATAALLNPSHQLQHQLESSFLQSQPSSVRRSLELVAERVASSCTKQLQAGPLSWHCALLHQAVTAEVRSHPAGRQGLDFAPLVATIKDGLSRWAREVSESHCRSLLSSCQSSAREFCSEHCAGALSHLLPPAPSPAAARVLADIAARNALTKVNTWLAVRLSLGEVHKQVLEEVDRAARTLAKGESHTQPPDPRYSNVLPPQVREGVHQDSAPPPADALVQLRETTLSVLGGHPATPEHLEAVLEGVGGAANLRSDLIPSARTALQDLSLDLVVALVCSQPEVLPSLLPQLSRLWSPEHLGRPDTVSRLLCPRNLGLLQRAPRPAPTWRALRGLLATLVGDGLLSPAVLEEQAVAVMQQDWPQEFLVHYTSCIEALVQDVSPSLPLAEAAHLSQLLGWLADYCRDLGDEFGEDYGAY